MNLKLELLKDSIYDIISQQITTLEIDVDKIAETTAIKALAEIQDIISNENKSDFDVVEQIVCVFEKYRLSFGGRHDF